MEDIKTPQEEGPKSIRDLWRKMSVSSKLSTIIGIMAVLLGLQMFALGFAMKTISSVRAIVTGESLWSKAQKDAVLHLHKYARTKDIAWYNSYNENMAVTFADSEAREALSSNPPNLQVARLKFLEGRNDPDDVENLIYLLQTFKHISYVKEAVSIWTDADGLIALLADEGLDLHHTLHGEYEPHELEQILTRIDIINEALTRREQEFSDVLGEASRWLERILMLGLLSAVVLVGAAGIYLTFSLSRKITRTLKELKDAAKEIESGNLNVQVAVHSRDELGNLAESINHMAISLKARTGEKMQAENASKVKSLFLANMSHEIRTPLSAIMGFAELLRSSQLSEKERQEYVSIILRTSGNLTHIINDILDLSKVEAGYLEIEKSTFSLTTLLHEIHMLVTAKKGKKPIDINFKLNGEVPELIHSDPVRLRQILLNVLSNAVKFTEKGSIETSYEVRNGKLRISVKDTGMGISPTQRAMLFQTFSQVDNSPTRRFEGTGLGLVLSRQLARILGGDVELASSEMGKGCTFVVSVKFEPGHKSHLLKPTQPLSQRAMETTQQLKGMSLLIVDDVEDNRLLIQRLLSRRGAQVDLAESAEEAIRMAQEKHYDILLMDIQMPMMDGYTATRTLRQSGYNKPIIALTAHAMKEDRERCLQAGCNDYLTKPLQVENVVNTLTKHTQLPYR